MSGELDLPERCRILLDLQREVRGENQGDLEENRDEARVK